MGRPALDTRQWIDLARKTHGDRYDYGAVDYKGYGCSVRISCPVHGEFVQRENNHRNGNGCPHCGVAARAQARAHGYDSFVESANATHNNVYSYPPQHIANSRTRAKIVCSEHGEFFQLVYQHLSGKGCTACGYEKNGRRSRLSLSDFIRRATEVHADAYEYVSGYTGMHANMQIRCKTHGVFRQTPSNHLKGAGCPYCVSRISAGEQALGDFVESLGMEIERSNKSVLGGLELDVYVPSKKLGIEFNGLWFHRESLVQNKTRTKWELCASKGVTLIQVFEDEWAYSRPIVEARLRAMLGCSPKFQARKCAVSRITSAQARKFLSETHLQGAGSSSAIAYGLTHEDQLVAVATFSKGRFNNSGLELLRYASVGRVQGGISKLVSAFRRDYPYGDLVSYADLRWGSGDAYQSAGFSLVGITEPDYWWADTSRMVRHSRYSLQKHKTGMPEKEYAEKHRLVKVLGVGHKKWILPARPTSQPSATEDNLYDARHAKQPSV